MECNEDLGSSCNLELEQDFSPLDTYIESVDSDAISGIQGFTECGTYSNEDVIQSDDSGETVQSDTSGDSSSTAPSYDIIGGKQTDYIGHNNLLGLREFDDAHESLLRGEAPSFYQEFATLEGRRCSSPSSASSPSLGSQQEVFGLLSSGAQYQQLGGPAQAPYLPVEQLHVLPGKMMCEPLAPLTMLVFNNEKDLLPQTNCVRSMSERVLVAGVHINGRHGNAFYAKWNWTKIRSNLSILNLFVLLSLLAAGIALLVKMPQGHSCDPPVEWWQGGTAARVLVPTFRGGDLRALVAGLDRIESLGVSMVRLAPIFARTDLGPEPRVLTPNLPPRSQGASRRHEVPSVAWNLTRVAPELGSAVDVHLLGALLHERNIKLLLELPTLDRVSSNPTPGLSAGSSGVMLDPHAVAEEVTRSIKFWLKLGVDGFMINGLELLALPQSNVSAYIADWRKILLDGSRKSQKILAVPAELLENVDEEEDGIGLRRSILRNVQLLTKSVELDEKPHQVMEQVGDVLSLNPHPTGPWIMWGAALPDQQHCGVWCNLVLMFLPGSASIGFSEPSTSDVQRDFSKEFEYDVTAEMGLDVTAMAHEKRLQPPLFVNGLFEYSGDFSPRKNDNYKARYMDAELLAVERFYPRRSRYVMVVNTANETVARDLSQFYYGGQVVASSHNKTGYIKFNQLTFLPREVIVCVLDK